MIQFQDKGNISVLNLCCRQVNDSHKATNIKQWINEILNEFEVEDKQILVLSTDSAANMQKAARLLLNDLKVDKFYVDIESFDNHEDSSEEEEDLAVSDPTLPTIFDSSVLLDNNIESQGEEERLNVDLQEQEAVASSYKIPCVVHQLQLAINKFFEDKQISKLLSAARSLSAKLRNHNISRMLKNESYNIAIMDQTTRWSSTSNMLDRLESLQPFCIANSSLFKGKISFSYKM